MDDAVWMRSLLMACAAAAVASLSSPRPARACSLAGNQEHTLDPEAQATDGVAPGAPVATVQTVKRGTGADGMGCSGSVSSCDDLGWIILQVSGTDDRTATDRLGYRLRLASGSLPSGVRLPSTPVRPAMTGGLLLSWIDGASDDQEALAFVLAVSAVDLAGNEGPATSVEVRDPGGGCSVAGGRLVEAPQAVVAALLGSMALSRRLRRPGPKPLGSRGQP